MAERASSRRTRSAPATSRAASGASPRSRSSSRSARSSRGLSRTSARSPPRRTRTRATAPTGWRSSARALGARRSSTTHVRRRGPREPPARRRRRPGRAATFTGADCHDWAGGRTGDGYAAQGNILVSARHRGRARRHVRGDGRAPLAVRLMDCLDAAEAAGGDSRGRSRPRSSWSSGTAATRALRHVVDLRVDDHVRPLGELRGSTESTTTSSARRRARTGSRSTTRSARSSTSLSPCSATRPSADWAGVENLEERVDGEDAGRPGRPRTSHGRWDERPLRRRADPPSSGTRRRARRHWHTIRSDARRPSLRH